tara:strand:- start:415 stop:1386 length:972 start_codon:yes stop_codon:yes gene_type:complete
MIIGSLPFTPLLFHGIFETSRDLIKGFREGFVISETIFIYSLCWLGSVFIFFSISSTKLTSYWLPATPAAAILISHSFLKLKNQSKTFTFIWTFNILILFGLTIAFFFSNTWLELIDDPEMPNLAIDLVSSGILFKAKLLFTFFAIFSSFLIILRVENNLLYLQIFLLIGQSLLMSPIRKLADNSRQLDLRNLSELIRNVREGNETLAMIGIRKPSLHYYSRQIVFYEPKSEEGLINLSERLNLDRRKNYQDMPNYDYKSLLIVIDKYSSNERPWSDVNHQKLGQYGIYSLWRITKNDLNKYSNYLINNGYQSDWEVRKVEKF